MVGPAAFAVLDQLDPKHETLAAHIANALVFLLQAFEPRAQPGALLDRRLDQVFPLNGLEHCDPGKRGKRVGHVGGVEGEARRVRLFLDFRAGRGHRQRQAAADCLRHGQDVGRDAGRMGGRLCADPTASGLGLIEDQQHAPVLGRGPERVEIALRRHDDTTRREDRLGDHRRARPVALHVEEAQPRLQAGHVAFVPAMLDRAAIGIGLGQYEATWDLRAIATPVRGIRRLRRRAGHPMPRSAEAHHLVTPGRGLGEPQRGLVAFGPSIDRQDALQGLRQPVL